MNSKLADQQVVARIGFAEQWLDRARQQCAEGNVARGWLTLVLADAEVHHALMAAAPPAAPAMRPRAHRVAPPLAWVAAGVAVLAVLMTQWPAGPSASGVAPAPPVVRLSTPGRFLEPAMQAIATTSTASASKAASPLREASRVSPVTTAARRQPVKSAAVTARPSPALTPVIAVDVTISQQPTSTSESAQRENVSSVNRHALEISAGDLIDLVLAAERTLRTEADRP